MESRRVARVAELGGLHLDGDVEVLGAWVGRYGLDIGWTHPTTPLGTGRLSW